MCVPLPYSVRTSLLLFVIIYILGMLQSKAKEKFVTVHDCKRKTVASYYQIEIPGTIHQDGYLARHEKENWTWFMNLFHWH